VISARIGVAAGVVEGILDTLQIPPRRGGLALLATGESAVAQARIIVALNAEGIAGADRPGRRAANPRQSARGQQGPALLSAFKTPAGSNRPRDSISATQAGRAGSCQLTLMQALTRPGNLLLRLCYSRQLFPLG
jgi:hypothetical protein